jgi:hypothetical protein
MLLHWVQIEFNDKNTIEMVKQQTKTRPRFNPYTTFPHLFVYHDIV